MKWVEWVLSAVLDPEVQDSLKRAVAKKAVELVKSGNVVGLGTGSTASMAIEELGKLIQAGKVSERAFDLGESLEKRCCFVGKKKLFPPAHSLTELQKFRSGVIVLIFVR